VSTTSSFLSSSPPSSLLTSSSSFYLFLSPFICRSTSTKLNYSFMRLTFSMIPKKSLKQTFLLSFLIMLLPKSLLLLSAVLKLSSNNLLVWPKNIFKPPLLTNIKFLLLLENNLLLLKFHPNFPANGFPRDIPIFILVPSDYPCLIMAEKVYLLQQD